MNLIKAVLASQKSWRAAATLNFFEEEEHAANATISEKRESAIFIKKKKAPLPILFYKKIAVTDTFLKKKRR